MRDDGTGDLTKIAVDSRIQFIDHLRSMGPGMDNASAMGIHVCRDVRGVVEDSRVLTPHITFARIRGSSIDGTTHGGNRIMSD